MKLSDYLSKVINDVRVGVLAPNGARVGGIIRLYLRLDDEGSVDSDGDQNLSIDLDVSGDNEDHD